MQKTYWLEVIGCGLKADWGCIHCSSSIKTYPELSIIWPTVWLHIKQRSKGSPKKLGILTALVKQWHLSYAAQGPLWQSVTKITADGDCSHEIKRRLFLGRKVMTNLDSIFKSRDITLPTKVRLVKAMVFLWSCMDVRVGLWRRLSAEELMLLNCGVGEDSWESLGLQGDPTSPFWRRSALRFLWKEWC